MLQSLASSPSVVAPILKKPASIGIVGAGAFGRFMAQHLQCLGPVCLYDADARALAVSRWAGFTVADLDAVARCRFVVLAVPLEALAGAASALAPRLRRGSVVIDVTSVKEEPLAILKRLLPPHVRVVGLHPVFGPQSGARGIAGMTVCHCDEGRVIDRFIARVLARRLGLDVVAMSAEEHDRQMGQVQGLTHAIARALRRLELDAPRLQTRSYQHLLEMVGIVGGDSAGVFRTIVAANPHARAAIDAFSREFAAVLDEASPEPSSL
jgi:prephenate dehydrogenase